MKRRAFIRWAASLAAGSLAIPATLNALARRTQAQGLTAYDLILGIVSVLAIIFIASYPPRPAPTENPGIARALTAKIEASRAAFTRGDLSAAIGSLDAYLQQSSALQAMPNLAPSSAEQLREIDVQVLALRAELLGQCGLACP